MDKKLKTKWLRALRSGKYKQARGAMRVRDGKTVLYCCLGVLRLIISPTSRAMASCSEHLCLTHAEKADLSMQEMEHLAHMNDGVEVKGIKQHSFREIALYIERNL